MHPRPSQRLAALTGLRFAAALGILLYHYGGPLVAGAPAWVERVRTGGHVWVGLFYVLSGFVLARAHPVEMQPSERRAFWIARLARLYPAYLLAFLLIAPFALKRWAEGGTMATAKAAIVALASLLLVQAWLPPIARLWNAPGWSTSVVLAFYLAFPYVVARLAPLSRRRLALALGGAWALSLAFPIAWLAIRPDGPVASWSFQEPPWLEALKFHPLARAGEFLAGVALGLLHRRGLALDRPAAAAAAPLAAGAVLAVLAWGGVPYPLLHNGLLVPLFAVIVLALAGEAGPAGRALASGPAQVLGDASFALYALQEPLWRWARWLAADSADPVGEPSARFVLAFSAAAIAIAAAVSRGLERPARRLLRAALGGEARPRGVPLTPAVPSERERIRAVLRPGRSAPRPGPRAPARRRSSAQGRDGRR